MIGIGKRIGNNKLQFTEGDAYASSQGGILVNPVCEQVQRNKLRGIALDAALAYVNAAMVAAKGDGATVLLTAEEVVDQLPANYEEAAFLYIPFARKTGVSYALKGPNLTIDRNSTATEVARDLLLDQAGLNVPRIEFYEDENLEPWSNTFSEWSLGANTASSLPVISSILGFSFGVNLFATGASGNAYATSDFTPVASTIYTYTAFVKSQSGAVLSLGKASITTGGVVNYTAFKSLGNGVYFMVVVETSAASPSALQVGQTLSGYNDLGEAIYFAGVQARRGDHRGALPQHYLATSGAAAYAVRPKGHLIESQGTNLLGDSYEFDTWIINGLSGQNTIELASQVDPRGLVSAARYTQLTTSSSNGVQSNGVVVESNERYVVSVKVKYVDAQYIALVPRAISFQNQRFINFDILNLTVSDAGADVGNLTAYSFGIREAENGYVLLWAELSTSETDLRIFVTATTGTSNNRVIGSFDIGFAQIKKGSYPSSSVYTNDAAATRLSETASATLAATLTSYTLVLRLRMISAPSADAALLNKSSSSQDDKGRVRIDTQGCLYYTSTATGALSTMTAPANRESIYILRVNAGVVDQFINGAKGATGGTNASDELSAIVLNGGANIQILEQSVLGVKDDAWCLENSQP